MASSQNSSPPPHNPSPFGGSSMDHNSAGPRVRPAQHQYVGNIPIPQGIPSPVEFDVEGSPGQAVYGPQMGPLNRMPRHMAERVYENHMTQTVAQMAHSGPMTFSQGMAHLDATKGAMTFFNQQGSGTTMGMGGQPPGDVASSSYHIPQAYRGTFGNVGQMLAAANAYTSSPAITQNLVNAGMANFAGALVTRNISGSDPLHILTQNYNNAVQHPTVAGGGLRTVDPSVIAGMMGRDDAETRENMLRYARQQMASHVGHQARVIGSQYDMQDPGLRRTANQGSPTEQISMGEMLAGQAFVHHEAATTALDARGFPLSEMSAPVSYRDALHVTDNLDIGGRDRLYSVNRRGGVRPVLSESEIETYHEAQGAVSVGSAIEGMTRHMMGDEEGRIPEMAEGFRSGRTSPGGPGNRGPGGRRPGGPGTPGGGGGDGEGAMDRLAAAAERAAAALGLIGSGGPGGGGGGEGNITRGFGRVDRRPPAISTADTMRAMGFDEAVVDAATTPGGQRLLPGPTSPLMLPAPDGSQPQTARPVASNAQPNMYGQAFKAGLASPFRDVQGLFVQEPLSEEEQQKREIAQTQRRLNFSASAGRRTAMGVMGTALGLGVGAFTGGLGTMAMLGGGAGLLGRGGLTRVGDAGGGFISGLTGGQATANDTRTRRVARGLGRATVTAGSFMAPMMRQPGVDMMTYFGQIPFGTRGLQGFDLVESLQGLAAPGELAALQASSLTRTGYSAGQGLMGAMGGNLDVFERMGMDRTSAAQMLQGLAMGGANMIGSGRGQLSLHQIADLTQGGTDVGGMISNASSFGFQIGERPNFQMSNIAFNLGARGSQRTALQSQLQGLSQGFAAQNLVAGDARSRSRYLSRIHSLGRGNFTVGQGVFDRGAGVMNRAKMGMASDYAGVAQSVLMAHAMRESGGNRLQALNYLENLQAQGGTALMSVLQQNGLDAETAQMAMRAEGLTGRDVVDLRRANPAQSDFSPAGRFTPFSERPVAQETQALPTTRLRAGETNRRIAANYEYMDLSEQKADFDARSEQYFLDMARNAGDGLKDLEKQLREFNKMMDEFIINQRQTFGQNLKTAMDPNAGTFERIGAALGSALYFGVAGFLEKNIGK